MLVAAVCWGFVIYASWVGGAAKDNQLIYFGLLACAVLTVVYYLMGAVVNEKMSTTVLISALWLSEGIENGRGQGTGDFNVGCLALFVVCDTG